MIDMITDAVKPKPEILYSVRILRDGYSAGLACQPYNEAVSVRQSFIN